MKLFGSARRRTRGNGIRIFGNSRQSGRGGVRRLGSSREHVKRKRYAGAHVRSSSRDAYYSFSELEHMVELRNMPKRKQSQARFRTVGDLSWVGALLAAAVLFLCASFLSIPASTARLYGGAAASGAAVMDFVGDVMLGRNIMALGETSGYESLFSGVQDYWSAADLVFANLETAVLRDDVSEYEQQEKEIHLWSGYDGLEAAMDAGINVWSCANNHASDYGERAVAELVEYFEAGGIAYSGIGRSLEEAAAYTVMEIDGIKVAFVSVTDVYYRTGLATDVKAGSLSTSYGGYTQLVYEAAQEADITVVYMHWGEENALSVSDGQVTLGRQLADAGADIVIGVHPHVVQEVELYRDSIIFYSLGNFVFDQGNTYARDSVMAEYTIQPDGSGAFRLYTVRINDGVPGVTTNRFYQWRINRELTQGLDAADYYVDDDGFVVIPFNIPDSNEEESGR